ncbi:hypothetical protein [Corallococcus llansteffanensis]|uniref:Uncharacterized protein n=1 Tax=Corallococcus llansteffanensis TaxID=2316731 RepID=A0A3A8QI68_9BACT|nr:hypothetical protein [Corallococcus llansteffanensis]RKH68277.1 hypothetical protein D7V93_01545 [Corallococcus llansteffanensis]
MSTAREIMDGIDALVVSLEALLKTDTVDALLQLVAELRISQPVKGALKALGNVLDTLVEWLGKLEQVAGVPRFLESVGPSVTQLDQLFSASGEQLQQSGMGALAPLATSAQVAVQLFDKVRRAVERVIQGMLPQEALQRLRDSVLRLKATLSTYGERLDGPPTRAGLASGAPALESGAQGRPT